VSPITQLQNVGQDKIFFVNTGQTTRAIQIYSYLDRVDTCQERMEDNRLPLVGINTYSDDSSPPPWRYSPNSGLGLPPWNSPFHFSVLDLRQSAELLGRVISSSQSLFLYTNTEKRSHTHKHQTFMSWVGFEPTILACERAKTVQGLDRSDDSLSWQMNYN
jgi:hypothetical protein